MTSSKQAQIAETLTGHQRQNASHCLCGWSKLGASHPAHQAAVLAPLITAAKAEAWDEGTYAYASRYVRDESLPLINPYRTEVKP